MAPEHLQAFAGRAAPTVIDPRSDLYALGLILYELLTGSRPATEDRLAVALSPAQQEPAVPLVLDRTIRRCLEPDPARRYQTAAELEAALDGCQQWQWTQQHLPAAGRLIRMAQRHPVRFLIGLPALVHLTGAILVVTWNVLWLSTLSQEWTVLFAWLSVGYTGLALVMTSWVAWRVGGPLWCTWTDAASAPDVDAATLAHRRTEALRVPQVALGLGALGWLPGTLVIPAILGVIAGPLVGLHLLFAFVLGGVLAKIYSGYAGLILTLRIGYPGMWGDAQRMWTTAQDELAGIPRKVRALQLLAGAVPLLGGMVLLITQSMTPDESTSGSSQWVSQILLLSLLALGMIGSGLTVRFHAYTMRTLAALTGTMTRVDSSR
jgi:hypothetical protein